MYQNEGDAPQYATLLANPNYRGFSESIVHFGLGEADGPIHLIRIEWPSGVVQEISNVSLNATHKFYEIDAIPEAGIQGPSSIALGEKKIFTLTVAPHDPGAIYSFFIDWNDDGIVDQVAIGPSGLLVQHQFDTPGSYAVTVTAVGDNNLESKPGLLTVNVYSAGAHSVSTIVDPNNPAMYHLVWLGSSGNDVVEFWQTGPDTVEVRTLIVDGQVVNDIQVFSDVTRVMAYGQAGNDKLDASQLSSIPVYFEGGRGSDTLIGGDAADVIKGDFDATIGDGAEGNDWIEGRGGNDTLYGDGGEGGSDTIIGGTGDNLIWGDSGDGAEGRGDSLIGGLGNDTIIGHAGNDYINGIGGDNLLIGGRDGSEGNDTIIGGTGNDILVGGKGADRLVATGGRNILLGGGGSDTLIAGGGGDILVADSTTYDLHPPA